MVLNNLADNGETQARAIGLAQADEGVKERVADAPGDAGPIVLDANLKEVAVLLRINRNGAVGSTCSFASVQDQVEKYALKFSRIEHTVQLRAWHQKDTNVTEFRP